MAKKKKNRGKGRSSQLSEGLLSWQSWPLRDPSDPSDHSPLPDFEMQGMGAAEPSAEPSGSADHQMVTIGQPSVPAGLASLPSPSLLISSMRSSFSALLQNGGVDVYDSSEFPLEVDFPHCIFSYASQSDYRKGKDHMWAMANMLRRHGITSYNGLVRAALMCHGNSAFP